MLLGIFNKDLLDEMFKIGMCDLNEYEEHLAISKTDKPLKALDYLYKSRGIKREAVEECGIGIDFVSKRWVIPIFSLSGEIVGFEYRGLDFKNKQIKKEVGTPTCLARIYGALNSKKVIIVEGLLDGVVLSQIAKDSLIVSCSNGVQGTLKCLSQLQVGKYNEIKLILDNDKAGDTETEKIISQYPFIKDCRKFLINFGAKDIGDWYMDKYVWETGND
jgi:DNA primase